MAKLHQRKLVLSTSLEKTPPSTFMELNFLHPHTAWRDSGACGFLKVPRLQTEAKLL